MFKGCLISPVSQTGRRRKARHEWRTKQQLKVSEGWRRRRVEPEGFWLLPSDDVRCGVIVLVRQLGLSPDLTSGVCPSLPVYISQTEKHVLTEMNTCWRARITKTTTVTVWRSDRGFLLSDGCQLIGFGLWFWSLVLRLSPSWFWSQRWPYLDKRTEHGRISWLDVTNNPRTYKSQSIHTVKHNLLYSISCFI